MERLWAPWRRQYITGEEEKKVEGCIFCELPAEGPEKYKENLILSCGERVFIILNRYPYNNGHLMVVPRAHVPDPALLPTSDYRMATELLRRITDVLALKMSCEGINIGMNLGRTAGAGIHEHCHYHLVPRWNGDTNFMPVTGKTKVLSVSLEDTYEQLYPELADAAQQVERDLAGEVS